MSFHYAYQHPGQGPGALLRFRPELSHATPPFKVDVVLYLYLIINDIRVPPSDKEGAKIVIQKLQQSWEEAIPSAGFMAAS